MDPREDSERLADDLKLPFPLLSDPDLRVISAWGVAMDGRDIAVPATFVVAPGGQVLWRHVGETMTDRPAHLEVLDVVERHVEGAR